MDRIFGGARTEVPGFGSKETEDRRGFPKLSSEKDWGSKRGASLSRALTSS